MESMSHIRTDSVEQFSKIDLIYIIKMMLLSIGVFIDISKIDHIDRMIRFDFIVNDLNYSIDAFYETIECEDRGIKYRLVKLYNSYTDETLRF